MLFPCQTNNKTNNFHYDLVMLNVYNGIDVSVEAINRPLPIARRQVLYEIQSLVRDKYNFLHYSQCESATIH